MQRAHIELGKLGCIREAPMLSPAGSKLNLSMRAMRIQQWRQHPSVLKPRLLSDQPVRQIFLLARQIHRDVQSNRLCRPASTLPAGLHPARLPQHGMHCCAQDMKMQDDMVLTAAVSPLHAVNPAGGWLAATAGPDEQGLERPPLCLGLIDHAAHWRRPSLACTPPC